MTSTAIFRFAALASIAVGTAASAQYTTVQPGAPINPTIAPGPVGVPGGRDGTITGSSLGDANLPNDRDRAGAATGGKDAAHPAKVTELQIGAPITDNKGVDIGYIKSIDPNGVVVATLAGPVRVPAEAIGKNKKGLLIGMSKADFDKLVAGASGG
jgi:hypothetical protein